MAYSGSVSHYTQRGMTGTENSLQQGSPPLYQLSSASAPYQTHTIGSSMGSALPVQPSSGMSAHGVNVGSAPSAVPTGETVRRKRGRPRKYGSDPRVSSALPSPPSSTPISSTSPPTVKRGRGRPPGIGRKYQSSSFGGWLSSSAGIGFTPHVLAVSVGEDIATKIISFSQQGPRAICVLSANGSVSTATLRQPSSPGTITYEGRFEILCLSGSFLLTANSASLSRAGGLSVTLASPDGRVIGGGVGGVLRAATPIQVIVGSFMTGGMKGKQEDGQSTELTGDPNRQTTEGPLTAAVQPSQKFSAPSSMGMWPSSHQDIQTAHSDIDLMQ